MTVSINGEHWKSLKNVVDSFEKKYPDELVANILMYKLDDNTLSVSVNGKSSVMITEKGKVR